MIGAVVFETLRSLVVGRCYPNTFPQDRAPVWPSIRYTVTDSLPVPDVCGTDLGETDETRLQIDCVAITYGAADILRNQVLAAMQTVQPPCIREGMFETFDSETKTHRVVIEFTFHPSSGSNPLAGVVPAIGTIAAREAADVFAMVGAGAVAGTMVLTETPDTFAIIGTGAGTVAGTMALVEAPDAFAITGAVVANAGTMAFVETPDTFAISGGPVTQVAFVKQVEFSTTGTPSTIDAPALTPTAGNFLVCFVSYLRNGAITTTLSDTTGSNGSWIDSGEGTVTIGDAKLLCRYLPNCAGGSSTIRATFSGGTIDNIPAIYVAEFSGVATASPLLDHAHGAQAQPGTGANVITTGATGTLASQPALVMALALTSGSHGSLAAGTGYTGLTGVWSYGLGGGTYAIPEWKRVMVTAAVTATWTDSSQGAAANYPSIVVAFKETP